MSSTQALRLRELVRQRKGLRSYTLALHPVVVKRRALKTLAKGDLLLLRSKALSLCISMEGRVVASCDLLVDAGRKRIRVTDLIALPDLESERKKYAILLPQITTVESPEIAVGDLIDIGDVDISRITITNRGREVASGHLVVADKQIAVMIDRCEKKGKR